MPYTTEKKIELTSKKENIHLKIYIYCRLWAENLNSVLDDNKLLTLPSGERINIPPNIRIVIEVDSLEQATPATVSRCGMVWFSDDTLTDQMRLQRLYAELSEWAEKRTKISPKMYSMLTRASEWVSDKIEWSEEYFQEMKNAVETHSVSERENSKSSKLVSGEYLRKK